MRVVPTIFPHRPALDAVFGGQAERSSAQAFKPVDELRTWLLYLVPACYVKASDTQRAPSADRRPAGSRRTSNLR